MADDLVFGVDVTGPRDKAKNATAQSFAPPSSDDGSITVPASGYGVDALTTSHVLNLDAGVSSEAELIEKYRTMALYSKIDRAVAEITNEAVVYEEGRPPVDVNLDAIDEMMLGKQTKNVIRENFRHILKMMNFNYRGYDIFKRWYVDSRLAYHKIVDKDNPQYGIQELRMLDPRKVKKIKEVAESKDPATKVILRTIVDEYYLYLEQASTYNKTFSGQAFGDAVYQQGKAPGGVGIYKIAKDAVAFAHSGQVDPTTGVVYGYLHKAIKPFNQLRMLEDALVIYRLARAPERRIFYVDTGALPPNKAEFYVKQLQNRYRSKVVYDVRTGEVADQRRTLAMQEDFWLPRREGSRGTQIDTLPGGQNLGEITDINYFKDDLWESLNVPTSRFKEGGNQVMFDGGFASISREELKFSKFIERLRIQFSQIFHDILKTQLIITGIVTPDEWDAFEDQIKYDFASDSHFEETKNLDLLQKRVGILAEIDPYIGKFFSKKWIKKNVLKQTDEAIAQMQQEIAEEALEAAMMGMPPTGMSPQGAEFPQMPAAPMDPEAMMQMQQMQAAQQEQGQQPVQEAKETPKELELEHPSAKPGFHVVTSMDGVHISGPHEHHKHAKEAHDKHERGKKHPEKYRHAVVLWHHGNGEWSHVGWNGKPQIARFKMK